jgi:nicotinate-nucleotide--dimethylbenzimidazole phosphoribosyltransferase
MLHFPIAAPDKRIDTRLQAALDAKTKPLGSLGRLEELALTIGRIQHTLTPALSNPHCVVIAADHGLAAEAVSAYPQEVTAQMVLNYLRGGAAVNVFARQMGMNVLIVDAGVKGNIPVPPTLLGELLHAKIAHGTRNTLHEAAMSFDECLKAAESGATIVRNLADDGCNVIAFGEMGIGNTSAAALITSRLCGIRLHDCIGRGTGLDDAGLERKREILERVAERHAAVFEPLDVLRTLGGFEIAMMCGGVLQAAELGMVVLVDGFIASAAVLVAAALAPNALEYCIFAHQSAEPAHALLLRHLGAQPLLDLDLRLGEGTGAVLAYPLLQAAVAMLNDMATFDTAGVSRREG